MVIPYIWQFVTKPCNFSLTVDEIKHSVALDNNGDGNVSEDEVSVGLSMILFALRHRLPLPSLLLWHPLFFSRSKQSKVVLNTPVIILSFSLLPTLLM